MLFLGHFRELEPFVHFNALTRNGCARIRAREVSLCENSAFKEVTDRWTMLGTKVFRSDGRLGPYLGVSTRHKS